MALVPISFRDWAKRSDHPVFESWSPSSSEDETYTYQELAELIRHPRRMKRKNPYGNFTRNRATPGSFLTKLPVAKRQRIDRGTVQVGLQPQRPYIQAARPITSEVKVTDHGLANVAIDSSGLMTFAGFNLTRGNDSYNNFEGNKINPMGWDFSVIWHYPTGVVVGPQDEFNFVRCILFQWNNSGVPLVTDILQNGRYLDPIKWENRDKINVFWDNRGVLAATTTPGLNGTENIAFCLRHYVKGKRIAPMEFLNGAPTPTKNGLYSIFISTSSVPAHPQIDFVTRMTFKDG